jgi:hypothetical protein
MSEAIITEMISAQYNPFVGDAPSEREAPPSPEIGLAPPMLASLPPMAPPMAAPPIAAPPFASAAGALAMAPLELAPLDLPPFEAPPFAPAEAAPMPRLDASQPEGYGVRASPMAPAFDDESDGAQVWSIRPGFESSLLMLGWADMLLKNVPSRDSLVDLVNYYHNIGWIGDPARDQILAYADGISVAPASSQPDWRASVEIHEKSLLFVEKLKAIATRGH